MPRMAVEKWDAEARIDAATTSSRDAEGGQSQCASTKVRVGSNVTSPLASAYPAQAQPLVAAARAQLRGSQRGSIAAVDTSCTGEQGDTSVTFIAGDIAAIGTEHGMFDAAVGRRVLMYQASPVSALQAVVSVLRPGALVVFQEADATMVPASRVPLPLNERANRWMWQTVEREGGNVHMGFELAQALALAGLIVEHVRAEAIVQTPTLRHPVGSIIRAMLPRILAHGVATEAEIDLDMLDERLAAECAAANATYIGDMAFGAWARVPAK